MKYAFNAIFTQENKGYSVLCPELGVASQGENLKDAESNIQEAITLYIEDMTQDELAPYSQVKPSPLIKTIEVVSA